MTEGSIEIIDVVRMGDVWSRRPGVEGKGKDRVGWVWRFKSRVDGQPVVTLRHDMNNDLRVLPKYTELSPSELFAEWELKLPNTPGCVVMIGGMAVVAERGYEPLL